MKSSGNVVSGPQPIYLTGHMHIELISRSHAPTREASFKVLKLCPKVLQKLSLWGFYYRFPYHHNA